MYLLIKNENHKTVITILTLLSLFLLNSVFPQDLSGLPKTDGKWVIVIDAGHGGNDPGALGVNSKEKDITLSVALLTGKYLEDNLDNVKVIYTRNKDVAVDLLERPKIANRNNADLFISIHANSVDGNNSVSGTETWIMGLAKDKASLDVAMRENQVILLEEDYSTKYEGFDPSSPESYIIFTLTHNLYQQQSTQLASYIQQQFKERVGRKDRGVKQAGYWVLYNTTMPSILIELGFMSNPSEEKYMASKQGQEYLASAIFRACRDYINEIDSKSSISITTQVEATKTEPASGDTVNNELFFSVQVATAMISTDPTPNNFKGHSNVIEIVEADRFKYAIGSFSKYEDAVSFRKSIETDYPDAFVVAIKENKVVPLRQVLENNND